MRAREDTLVPARRTCTAVAAAIITRTDEGMAQVACICSFRTESHMVLRQNLCSPSTCALRTPILHLSSCAHGLQAQLTPRRCKRRQQCRPPPQCRPCWATVHAGKSAPTAPALSPASCGTCRAATRSRCIWTSARGAARAAITQSAAYAAAGGMPTYDTTSCARYSDACKCMASAPGACPPVHGERAWCLSRSRASIRALVAHAAPAVQECLSLAALGCAQPRPNVQYPTWNTVDGPCETCREGSKFVWATGRSEDFVKGGPYLPPTVVEVSPAAVAAGAPAVSFPSWAVIAAVCDWCNAYAYQVEGRKGARAARAKEALGVADAGLRRDATAPAVSHEVLSCAPLCAVYTWQLPVSHHAKHRLLKHYRR